MAISTTVLLRALALRDLTDPAQGPHAMQVLLDQIHAAIGAPVRVHRGSPIVSVTENYDALGYPRDAIARDTRYTRYVCDTAVLRTQTSAMLPPLRSRARGARGPRRCARIGRARRDDPVRRAPGGGARAARDRARAAQ